MGMSFEPVPGMVESLISSSSSIFRLELEESSRSFSLLEPLASSG
jgi:hypothetical protein